MRDFTLAEVISLSPRTDLGIDLSWFTHVGLIAPREFQMQTLTAYTSGGIGYSFGGERSILSVMLMGEALGDSPSGAHIGYGVRSLMGLKGERWKFLTDFRQVFGAQRRFIIESSFSWSLTQDWAVRLSRFQSEKAHFETLFGIIKYF